MPQWFVELFFPNNNPDVTQSIIVILLTIGIGFFVGQLKIKNVGLGVSAVIFVGLILGHYGYKIKPDLISFMRDFGLILFVYAMGIQVGPSFFSSFKKGGLKINILAVSAVIIGGAITFIIVKFSLIAPEYGVGLMSGAVTNTPGLGAAKATLGEIQDKFPNQTFGDPTVAYAIAYPFGVLGIIMAIVLTKALFRINLAKEYQVLNDQKTDDNKRLVFRKCRITNDAFVGKEIEQIFRELDINDVIISRLKNSSSKIVYSPSLDTRLSHRDVLMLVGDEKEINFFIEKTGAVSTDTLIESEEDVVTRNIFVTNSAVVHKTLAELDLYNRFNLKVTRVFRAGMEMLARPNFQLHYGDKLRIVGGKEISSEAEKLIGNSEKNLLSPDFLSLFSGLIVGILVGSIPIVIPSLPIPIKLGFAAGPLLVALFISRYGGIGIIHSYINNGAIHFMKDLGVCLFFASAGIQAGEHFYSNFIHFNGWLWVFYGSFVTIIPIIFIGSR